MAEFKEVMKQKERMCAFHLEKMLCGYCPIYDEVHAVPVGCNDYILAHPEEAEAIIMKWAEKHPVKTNADKFKEVFGDIALIEECSFIGCVDGTGDCTKCKYHNFWKAEYKEPSEV